MVVLLRVFPCKGEVKRGLLGSRGSAEGFLTGHQQILNTAEGFFFRFWGHVGPLLSGPQSPRNGRGPQEQKHEVNPRISAQGPCTVKQNRERHKEAKRAGDGPQSSQIGFRVYRVYRI